MHSGSLLTSAISGTLMLSDSVCLPVSLVCRGYSAESERTVAVKKHYLLLHPHMVRATCPQREERVCVSV